MASPESLHQWKIFTKVLANRLQKYLPKLIHPAQYGFIAGRNILHNVLNVQMAMGYAHPLLVMLSRLATNGDIVGLHLPSGGQLVAQALADDSFMFLQASRENLEKGMLVWNQFALASGLNINWRKSSLISCTERNLECLG